METKEIILNSNMSYETQRDKIYNAMITLLERAELSNLGIYSETWWKNYGK